MNKRIESENAYMTSPIGDLPINSEGLRKAVDEIKRLQKEVAALAIESVERDKALAKLEAEVQHWAEAEKDERLVVLPCRVGDTVYVIIERPWIHEIAIEEQKITEISRKKCGVKRQYVNTCIISKGTRRDIENFGKTVFLTREEAEQALKEAQSHE